MSEQKNYEWWYFTVPHFAPFEPFRFFLFRPGLSFLQLKKPADNAVVEREIKYMEVKLLVPSEKQRWWKLLGKLVNYAYSEFRFSKYLRFSWTADYEPRLSTIAWSNFHWPGNLFQYIIVKLLICTESISCPFIIFIFSFSKIFGLARTAEYIEYTRKRYPSSMTLTN